ncbi:hypothetical protein F0562_016392 [Nyssa sinensis]|uniref:SCP domain-containing protein n=1 Tax=Nyssa sinensis TaxID=561372 RepID=A0A5J4ZM28_9ASTE|nr:hypothetical protein F0562_016392 [Nyssa sinensis]
MRMSSTGILSAIVIAISLHMLLDLVSATPQWQRLHGTRIHYHPGPHHKHNRALNNRPLFRPRNLHIQKPKVTSPVPKPPQPLRQQALPGEAGEYIAAHNLYRQKVKMPPLKWDQSLARYAQRWAEERINDCSQHTHSKGPHGENMLWEQYDELNPDGVVQVWFDEQPNYDHQNLRCKCSPNDSSCMCGHYTQLVWSTTKRVGCGNVTCNNDKAYKLYLPFAS